MKKAHSKKIKRTILLKPSLFFLLGLINFLFFITLFLNLTHSFNFKYSAWLIEESMRGYSGLFFIESVLNLIYALILKRINIEKLKNSRKFLFLLISVVLIIICVTLIILIKPLFIDKLQTINEAQNFCHQLGYGSLCNL